MGMKHWRPEEKLAIVMEGLRNEVPVAEICRRHGISATQFYKWRNAFLEGGKRALSGSEANGEMKRLRARVRELEALAGKLALHNEILKKTLGE